jgi:Family of unknown function (DUF6502)
MSNEIQVRLLTAVYACMRPLARMLMRSGVTYKSFAEAAKTAFVHEALLERDTRGRNTNASRVAVRTGLSRKEVRRVCDATVLSSHSMSRKVDHAGPPARVLHTWHFDPRFMSAEGKPRDLFFEGASPNFTDLVKAAGGDVPPGAVRAELLRASAVLELENGLLRATKRYFVPGDFDEKTITTLSGMLFPFLSGIENNSNPARQKGFIQRIAYARLSDSSREEFRLWSRAEGTRFIESIDDWLMSHEDPAAEQEGGPISGMGLFYYEGPEAEFLPKPKNES